MRNVDETDSGTKPITDFGINMFEPSVSAILFP
jgi:hypothetical protein